MGYYYSDWAPYVPVAERRRKAAREMEKLRKQGHPVSPVSIEGRTIARTFWGKAWCENLEKYSDYENRLPRGRTTVTSLRWTVGVMSNSSTMARLCRLKAKGCCAPASGCSHSRFGAAAATAPWQR